MIPSSYNKKYPFFDEQTGKFAHRRLVWAYFRYVNAWGLKPKRLRRHARRSELFYMPDFHKLPNELVLLIGRYLIQYNKVIEVSDQKLPGPFLRLEGNKVTDEIDFSIMQVNTVFYSLLMPEFIRSNSFRFQDEAAWEIFSQSFGKVMDFRLRNLVLDYKTGFFNRSLLQLMAPTPTPALFLHLRKLTFRYDEAPFEFWSSKPKVRPRRYLMLLMAEAVTRLPLLKTIEAIFRKIHLERKEKRFFHHYGKAIEREIFLRESGERRGGVELVLKVSRRHKPGWIRVWSGKIAEKD